MTVVPPGWTEATLGELGDYWNGRAFKKDDWRPPGEGRRPIIRIQDLTGSNENPNYYDGEAAPRHVVRRGDLLVSWAATLGVYEWSGPEAVVNQHIFKVESFIDRRFHRYLIEHALDDLRRRAHGTGMVHVTRKVFDETPVLLPPLSEQERIVAAIEEQLSRIHGAQLSLQSAEARVSRYRESALRRLIDWRWHGVPIGELAASTLIGLDRGRAHQRATAPGVPYVRMNAISREGAIDWLHIRYVDATPAEVDRFAIQDSDILFNTRNSRQLVGKVGLVKRPPENAVFNNNIMRIRTTPEVLPQYVVAVMTSSEFRRQLNAVTKGTTNVAAIYAKDLLPLRIPTPPLDIQREIVSELDRQMSTAAQVRNSITTARERAHALARSILAKGFSGRLVRQDPDDEPAAELLARVVDERTGAPKSRRSQHA